MPHCRSPGSPSERERERASACCRVLAVTRLERILDTASPWSLHGSSSCRSSTRAMLPVPVCLSSTSKTCCLAVVTRFTEPQVKYAGYGAVKFEWARGRLFDRRIAGEPNPCTPDSAPLTLNSFSLNVHAAACSTGASQVSLLRRFRSAGRWVQGLGFRV